MGSLFGNTAPLLPDERVTTVEPLTSDCKKIVYVTTEKFFWTSTTDECTSCKILGSFPNGISCCAPRPAAFPDVTANSFYVCSGKNLSLYSFNASEFERKNLRHFRSTLISSVAGVGTGSGQSSVVVTGMRNGTIQLSAEVGKSWPPFDVKKRHSDVVTAIYPTARDFNFVSVSERGSAKLWDIRFFSESSVFDIVDSTTHSQRCATASTEGILAHCSQERGISFYSTVTGEKLHSVESACKRQICTTTNAVLKNTACSSELLLLSRDFTDHYIMQKYEP
ncbi:hypothetical protein AGDE_12683 [Angomonas deanei]|uniref:WD domain, G-beta repeat n=1 Tax=Angomonas deanei TaxID=59799 RepID=A0A7G2CAR7_9TRYP|nr:hypothetical protein AGDE_12683 [Angomonas deanei]CAD2215122.1 hypothetical protein, conserved [Angomonas deanei]|eukprot:EPY24001.1 hypothetical protein AGDE_12683 [Angomonas deanei]